MAYPTFLLVVLTAILSSCSYLTFWKTPGEEPVKEEAETQSAPNSVRNIRPVSPEELELKQARLWARVDELEAQVQRQKEKLHLIEKGLVLGIVPEELKKLSEEENKGQKASKNKKKDVVSPEVNPKEPAISEEKSKPKASDPSKEDSAQDVNQALTQEGGSNLTEEQKADYQKRMADAQDQMREGRYGRAIVELDQITKLYGSDIGGALHMYWLGKCWAGLKDYQAAKQAFNEIVTKQTKSPWFPRAKLELARVEMQLGLRETALQRLKEIISAFPDEDAAEMAKMELKHMKQSL